MKLWLVHSETLARSSTGAEPMLSALEDGACLYSWHMWVCELRARLQWLEGRGGTALLSPFILLHWLRDISHILYLLKDVHV